ncbi:hypothetical protein CDAR_510321 [Caerostris darwini]|uniref:Uncharacterized protein n=1 Tax=Caerostris darwini TaxID=1538125 RepID=A0AAV4SIY4_9ARAC|nr:hypothetical protein CDAR_510321 [Caerostris darwini]
MLHVTALGEECPLSLVESPNKSYFSTKRYMQPVTRYAPAHIFPKLKALSNIMVCAAILIICDSGVQYETQQAKLACILVIFIGIENDKSVESKVSSNEQEYKEKRVHVSRPHKHALKVFVVNCYDVCSL